MSEQRGCWEQRSRGQVDPCCSSQITARRAARSAHFPPQTCHLNSAWMIILDVGSSRRLLQRGDKGYAVMSDGSEGQSHNPLPDTMMSLRGRRARRHQMRAGIWLLLVLAGPLFCSEEGKKTDFCSCLSGLQLI